MVEIRKSSVKVMCPRCRDVYVGYNDRRKDGEGDDGIDMDGCFFGESFPMEFLIHNPEYGNVGGCEKYKLKLYGFELRKESGVC